MPSSTSGTTDFFLDVDDIIEQAFEPLGGEHTSGEEAQKARRILNLILIELQNKGVPINKLDFLTQALTEDQTEYNLDPTIVDVFELNLLRDGTETPLTRYTLREFHQIPIKSTKTRPSVWTIERNSNDVQLKLWPTPDNSTDTVELMVYKKLEDIKSEELAELEDTLDKRSSNIIEQEKELISKREEVINNQLVVEKKDKEVDEKLKTVVAREQAVAKEESSLKNNWTILNKANEEFDARVDRFAQETAAATKRIAEVDSRDNQLKLKEDYLNKLENTFNKIQVKVAEASTEAKNKLDEAKNKERELDSEKRSLEANRADLQRQRDILTKKEEDLNKMSKSNEMRKLELDAKEFELNQLKKKLSLEAKINGG